MSAAEDFFTQLEKISAAGIDRVILREKQLTEKEYEALAKKAAEICGRYSVPLSLHTFVNAAERLGSKDIHLTFADFTAGLGKSFETVGVSVHSLEEAELAESRGAAYVTAGHIFATDCKKGLPPRGVEFLKEMCKSVKLPVYAIGGITPENVSFLKEAGAAGACVMSGLMRSKEPEKLIKALRIG